MRRPRRWPLLALALLLSGCGQPAPAQWTAAERAQIVALSLTRLPPPPADPGNRHADDPRAAALGADLFGDARLSRNGAVACASCHQPQRHFTDGRPRSRGLGDTRRHAPSLLAAAWSPWLFWDGRADSLWAQALGPMSHPDEQGLAPAQLKQRIAAHYRAEYEALFGELVSVPAEQVAVNVAKAIEAFERTLRPAPGRFDTYADALVRGEGEARPLLSDSERGGLKLFIGRAQCVRCHFGPLLTNHGFHNTGLAALPGQALDRGRAEGLPLLLASNMNCRSAGIDAARPDCPHLEFARIGAPEWVGAFKTPSLRFVAATAPYMHDGRFATLPEVLEHYNRAPNVHRRYGHSELFPLGLSAAELRELEAFLRSLGAPEKPS